MFKTKISGIPEMTKAFDTLAEDMQDLIIGALDDSAELVARDARADAPVDTGRGKASIRTETGLTKYGKPYGSVVCGEGDAYHMNFIEYGTAKMKAQPFMRPAADKNRDKIVVKVKDAIKKAKWQ